MLDRPAIPAILGLLLLAASFAVAAARYDRAIMEIFYLQPPELLPVMKVLTQLGGWIVLAIAGTAGIVFAIRQHGRDQAVRLGIGMGVAELFTSSLKLILRRTRPDFLHQVTALGSSFPSGHSLNSALIWCLLALVIAQVGRRRKKWARLLYLIPPVVGWTRVYLGVHWPSDVLGGWGFGLLLLTIIAGSRPLAAQAQTQPSGNNASRTGV